MAKKVARKAARKKPLSFKAATLAGCSPLLRTLLPPATRVISAPWLALLLTLRLPLPRLLPRLPRRLPLTLLCALRLTTAALVVPAITPVGVAIRTCGIVAWIVTMTGAAGIAACALTTTISATITAAIATAITTTFAAAPGLCLAHEPGRRRKHLSGIRVRLPFVVAFRQGLRHGQRHVEIDFLFVIGIARMLLHRQAIADVIEFLVNIAGRNARAYAARLFCRQYAIAKIIVQDHMALLAAI